MTRNFALIQLAYFSSVVAHPPPFEIERILSTSRENNRRRGITGMLVFDGHNFLQILEGAKDPILRLFDVIKEDRRHTGVIEILQQPVAQRDFPDWPMAFRDLSTGGMDYPDGFNEFLKEHFDMSSLQPSAAIELLSLFKKRGEAEATASNYWAYSI
jgi:hypothetical protein